MPDRRLRARPYLTAAKDFASGKDDPRAFLERCVAEIEAREGQLLALTATSLDGARAAADASAARWRKGEARSPIDGMPVGVKDVIETIDMPTCMGSPLFEGWRSDRDSASVFALREAGAVIVAKTVTTEFAAAYPGPTRNPWDIERTPGGSSSGSAAGVASGYFTAGLGTQVIGSILRPASFCGVVGFKPSFGAINRGGSHDYMSQSSQGVLAATIGDCWAAAWEISSRAGGDPGYGGLHGSAKTPHKRPARLALLETAGWTDASDEAKQALHAAVDHLRAAGVEVLTRADASAIEDVEQAIGNAMALSLRCNAWESRWPLNTYRDRDGSKLSKDLFARSLEAESMTLDDYRAILAERAAARATYARLSGSVDAVVTLAASGAAPKGLASTGNGAFAVVSSMLGTPSISIPVLAEGDLPLGMQVIGFADDNYGLVGVAAALMDMLPADAAVRA